jgi:RNA polymerase sigma-70 factor, ECF subfamily
MSHLVDLYFLSFRFGGQVRLDDLLAETSSYTERVARKLIALGRYRGVQAADVGQEATIKIWRGLDAYSGTARYSSWAYRIVQNSLRDALRRNNPERVQLRERSRFDVDGTTTPYFEPTPGQAILDSLSERDALIMVNLAEGVAVADIASALGTSTKAVYNRIQKIREKYRRG